MDEFYFTDPLFRFQTYLSGWVSPRGAREISPVRTKLQDLGPVWDDYRGAGVEVGILPGLVDHRHPDLGANYVDRYLAHYDPVRDPEFADPDTSIGTLLAGIVAADDDGWGFAGVAPDAGVFSWTGDAREDPDVVVTTFQFTEPYEGDPAPDTHDVFTAGRDGLGTVALSRSPVVNGILWERNPLGLGDGPDHLSLFEPGRVDQAGEPIAFPRANGVVNSEYGFHALRSMITVAVGDMGGLTDWGGVTQAAGPMTLATAPFFMEAYVLADVSQDNVIGLDHADDDGLSAAGAGLGFWVAQAEPDAGVDIDGAQYRFDELGDGASAFAAGVVALMLEAEPGLGWRDVQEILAYSADPMTLGLVPGTFDPDEGLGLLGTTFAWGVDGEASQTWNGAGLMFSHDYGFGTMDGRAAVRLAETWDPRGGARTSANEVEASTGPVPGSDLSATATPRVASGFTLGSDPVDLFEIAFEAPRDLRVEHVALDVGMRVTGASSVMDEGVAHVGLTLVAPDGQETYLAGQSIDLFPGYGGDRLDHTFTSRAFWGRDVDAGGTWTLRVDANTTAALSEVAFDDLELTFYGAPAGEDDRYVYTDAIGRLTTFEADASYGLPEGAVVADVTGHGGEIEDGAGFDTLNAAAMTADLRLEAGPGGTGTALGTGPGGTDLVFYTLAPGTAMDALVAGDGDDTLIGAGGAEVLEGGRGDDRLTGGAGADTFRFGTGAGRDTITDFAPREDRIEIDGTVVAPLDSLALSDTASGARAEIGEGRSITFAGLAAADLGGTGGGSGGLTPEEARLVAYLYEAGLDRDGDIDLAGLNFWIDRREAGLSEVDMARFFLDSPEFEAAFGDPAALSDRALVERLYENVLDRPGEAAGVDFWVGTLADPGYGRAALLRDFAASPENLAASAFVETLSEVAPGEWAFD